MSGHKAKAHRKKQEAIMFGKMCGCGECRFCHAYEQEKVWEQMGEQIRRGKEIAEAGRKEWIEKINRS